MFRTKKESFLFEETNFFYQKGERIPIMLGKLYFPFIFLINISIMLFISLTVISYPFLFQNVPSLEETRLVKPLAPAEFYSKDGVLLQTFGKKLRLPVQFNDIPENVRNAFIAAEDSRFFTHPGIDYQGLIRALINVMQTQEKSQGGSTITMQLARALFLSREKTLNRKFKEILIAMRLEQSLSKEEIFTLYLNKIFLGYQSYGIAAAAKVYYQKSLAELSVAEAASLAGLPKAPSAYNPIINPQRALIRRGYVLGRMRDLGFIDQPTYQTAMASPETAKLIRGNRQGSLGLYAVEMARQELFASLGKKLYEDSYQIFLNIDSKLQAEVEASVQTRLEQFDRKRGYRGSEAQLTDPSQYENFLQKARTFGSLEPAIVLEINNQHAELLLKNGQRGRLPAANIAWSGSPSLERLLKVGEAIRVRATDQPGVFTLEQVPEVTAAAVVEDTYSGAILAMVGGYDFFYSKFNRASQSQRPPGSSFKPFVYSAALEQGFAPNSRVLDAPLTIGTWKPRNYSGDFKGSMTIRNALAQSRNLPVIRVMQKIGTEYTVEFIKKFGFLSEQLPVNLTLALGTATTSPLEMGNAFAVFANGGYLLTPQVIAEVRQYGQLLTTNHAQMACSDCPNQAPRVISAGNAFLMQSLLQEVIRKGTGQQALSLKRADVAGKTGTTDDERDAWFVGFHPEVVASVWVGYDDNRPLGAEESGGRTALPIWVDIMGKILPTLPEKPFIPPEGIVKIAGDYYFGKKTQSAESSASENRPAIPHTPRSVNEADDRGLAGGLF